MSRDFDTEFSQIMIQFAAEDVELVDHFRSKMFGDEPPETPDSAMESMTRVQYVLEKPDYSKAVGLCVAKLAGVKLGSEVFSGKT